MVPVPVLSIKLGSIEITDGGYPFDVGCSPNAKPTSLLAWAIRVRESIISKTFFPLSLKYSAIDVALSAPLILNRGDLSAGTATITVFCLVFSLKTCLTKLPTSLLRSPIRATTTTSADVNLVIMLSSIDFPTPEPAIIPSLCPLPTVRRELIALIPTSNGSLIGSLFIGLTDLPVIGQ